MTAQAARESTRPKFRAYTAAHLGEIGKRAGLTDEQLWAVRAVASVLPFRTNNYVMDELIDWSAAPDDPVYRLTVPQPDMLAPAVRDRVAALLRAGAPATLLRAVAREIHRDLNPHPAGQTWRNVPSHLGSPLSGVQHKYRETVLFFPRPGQTCQAYCTYCFRWPQFVGAPELKMAAANAEGLRDYLLDHPEVTDVLITGGDPMVMSAPVLRRFLEPLLDPRLVSVTSIRIGTKALSYWPYRFLTDPDADDLLRLLEHVVRSGRHLALMAHVSHPRELAPEAAVAAVARLRETGAVIRCQAPLIRGVNDDAAVWAELWHRMVRLGAVPYYLFVERDTGPRDYFAVPLARAWEIFSKAYRRVSGLARTVRGPIMSTEQGKVCVDGVVELAGERAFALHFVQARDPDLVNRPFFARYDPAAIWLDQLRPVPGTDGFPYG